MRKLTLKSAAAAALFSWAFASGASATTVNWTTEGGANKFNSSFITFAGFQADKLVSISGNGTYEGSNPGSPNPTTTFDLIIILDGVETLLKEWTLPSTAGPSLLSSLLSGPIYFSPGTVTGILLTSAPAGPVSDKNYQAFNTVGGETFTFATPLPGALSLFAGGLVLVGLLSRRRKQAAL